MLLNITLQNSLAICFNRAIKNHFLKKQQHIVNFENEHGCGHLPYSFLVDISSSKKWIATL